MILKLLKQILIPHVRADEVVVLQSGSEPTTTKTGAVVLLNDGPPPTSVILAWLDRTLNLVERQRWSRKVAKLAAVWTIETP